ncbi:MAG: hypothetical protein O2797_04940 [Bacteroidetes bacterium]|nr:hypothetical protein [Bacteroidota bacterium]MDA1333545.1 hypothetical protein [Bacteroidota bacterium]
MAVQVISALRNGRISRWVSRDENEVLIEAIGWKSSEWFGMVLVESARCINRESFKTFLGRPIYFEQPALTGWTRLMGA